MRDVEVVTCFLLRRTRKGDEVLLLRRSERVGTYRGKWAGVSGYLEPGASATQQAEQEVGEETGLSPAEVRLLRRGPPLEVVDGSIGVRWTVHPFLFEMGDAAGLRLGWEHVEARWLRPQEMWELETVPGLAEALERVYPEREDAK